MRCRRCLQRLPRFVSRNENKSDCTISWVLASHTVFSTLTTEYVRVAETVAWIVGGGRYVVATLYALVGNWGDGDFAGIVLPGFFAIGAYLVGPVCKLYGIVYAPMACLFRRSSFARSSPVKSALPRLAVPVSVNRPEWLTVVTSGPEATIFR